MLGEITKLVEEYLFWVEYNEFEVFIQIHQQYMCKNDGNTIKIMKDDLHDFKLEIFTYKRGIKHGASKRLYSSGQIYSLCHYKNGKLAGAYKFWYKNGNLSLKIFYVNGLEHGKEVAWLSDRRLAYKKRWINGFRQI